MDTHRRRWNLKTSRIGRLYNRLAKLLYRRPGRLEAFEDFCREQEENEATDVDRSIIRSNRE